MANINILALIAMTIFFFKFYLYIGFNYIFNFLKYIFEILFHGNSKTVICPFKNTHEDVFLQIEELIQFQGFTIHNYQFETPDNAYVSFWRVKTTDPKIQQQKYPILILHGLLDCSVSWFLHSDKSKCLPYILANQGYDVWVGNNRGTKHSLKNSHQDNYWNFCFDHFVQYDQPTMINSILHETKSQKLIYIGHSQGSTQFLVSSGLYNFNDKIVCFIGMGTTISLENVTDHLVLKCLSIFKCVEILKLFGFKTILNLPKWLSKATGILIYNTKFYFNFFFGIVNALCGKPTNNKIDKQRLGVIISHQPGGASIPNVQQWLQFYKTGKMRKFDYGKKKNYQLYGNHIPPQYTFDHFKTFAFNSYIFKGEKDAIISEKDFQKIVKFMNPDKFETIVLPDYAHLDYVWGKQANQDIYNKIQDILKYECQN